jgi:hypothetical protein
MASVLHFCNMESEEREIHSAGASDVRVRSARERPVCRSSCGLEVSLEVSVPDQ